VNYIFSEEKSNLIAPISIILLIFCIPLSPSLKSIMLVLSLAALLLTPYYRRHLFDSFNTLWGRMILAFFSFILIASLWSKAPFLMRFIVISKYFKLIYLPIFAVGFINSKTRRWAFNSYFGIMLITCFFSFLKQKGYWYLHNPQDTGEVFHNHISTGYMVALAVYFAGILSFESQISKGQRAYYLLMVAVGSYQMFFLNTGRTGYATYALLITLLFIQKLPFKKALIGILLFCGSIGLIYTMSPLMQARTAALISDIKFLKQHEENTSLGFRVQFHNYARSLFERQPIFGLGTGSFKYHFSIDQPIPSWDNRLHDPHSQYWLILAEQGIVGLIFLFVLMGTLFITALKLNQETRPILVGILISFGIVCFTDSVLCYSTAGMLLILFCALGFGELLEERRSRGT
jgi:O-antigen ligase